MRISSAVLSAMTLLTAGSVQADALDAFYTNPVYRAGASASSCETFPQGIPQRLNGTDTRAHAKIILNGGGALVVTQGADGVPRSHYFYLKKASCDWLELQVKEDSDPDAFAAALAAKYDTRIHFQSSRAEQVVRDYRVDCAPVRAQRYLPLINVLYYSLSTMSRPDLWLELNIEDHDGEIQFVNVIRNAKRPQGERVELQRSSLRIDKAGQMSRPNNATQNIFDQLCAGFDGPYWRNKSP
ncbi:hypothetical protein [Bordetella genomosp. 4]|uniref:hypothetical protein n=1 Tax=Bordetella genomosp. 4 TaxID=463044 RepID=UPI00113FE985|nr:hypothetical protein [Bordetella genomosp. 4]